MKKNLSVLNKRKLGIFAVLALLLLIAIFGKEIYLFVRYQDAGEREAYSIIYRIQDSVQVPEGDPGLATVEDKTKISKGGVLKTAQNGDKVLLFYKSSTAMLYRPSSGKVVAIGPIVVDPSASQVKGTRVEVRNGSGDIERYQAMLKLLRERYPTANIVAAGNAVRDTYPKTIIIDQSSNENSKTQFANAIIELTGGQSGVLPLTEQKSSEGILIIVGTDK